MMAEPTYPDLKGRTALVTGGADGIGRAAVAALARQGMRVGFIDIAADAGRTLEAELRATGADVAFAHADLRDLKTTLSAVDSLQAQLGPVAILVNNLFQQRHFTLTVIDGAHWTLALTIEAVVVSLLA